MHYFRFGGCTPPGCYFFHYRANDLTGEMDLSKMLRALSPTLIAGQYVFCMFEQARYGDHCDLQPIAAMAEREGLTLVIPKGKADEHGISYEAVFRGITLNVHSNLEAVGLTAAFASKLASYGISANVIAGYFHDHIFVQSDLAEKAVAALEEFVDE